MAGLDNRIIRRGAQIAERDAMNRRHDLEELQAFIADDVYNMLRRCLSAGFNKEDAAKQLHTKNYDDTYHDWGPEGKRKRTRARIEALLVFVSGDTQLLLQEYGLALDRYFPISGPFVWAPKLINKQLSAHRVRVSMGYYWRRSVEAPRAEGSSDISDG